MLTLLRQLFEKRGQWSLPFLSMSHFHHHPGLPGLFQCRTDFTTIQKVSMPKKAWGMQSTETTRKNGNAANNVWWQSVQDPCRIELENCSCAYNISTWGWDLKVFYFRHIFRFLLHIRCASPILLKFVYSNQWQTNSHKLFETKGLWLFTPM